LVKRGLLAPKTLSNATCKPVSAAAVRGGVCAMRWIRLAAESGVAFSEIRLLAGGIIIAQGAVMSESSELSKKLKIKADAEFSIGDYQQNIDRIEDLLRIIFIDGYAKGYDAAREEYEGD
jgi:hypothetical protein